MRMISVGVDYSTRKVSAVALYEGLRLGPMLNYSIKAKEKPTLETAIEDLTSELDEYLSAVREKTDFTQEVRCVLEAPIIGNSTNRRVGVNMGVTCGALASTALLHHSRINIVAPASWKKVVCGHGHLNKDGVMAWMEFTYPYLAKECRNDDDFDAMCLALYASKQEEAL